jgi:hypothetical protein
MGIAGVEPHQLAPSVGTTGSGSTDSPAPSPTNTKIDIDNTLDTAVGIAVPIDADTNAKINIDNTIDTTVGIAVSTDTDANAEISIDTIIDTTIDIVAGIVVPAIIDANPLELEVDSMESIVIDIAPSNATEHNGSSFGDHRRLRHGLRAVQLPRGQQWSRRTNLHRRFRATRDNPKHTTSYRGQSLGNHTQPEPIGASSAPVRRPGTEGSDQR